MGSFNIFGICQQEKLCGLRVSFLGKYLVTDSSSLLNTGLVCLDCSCFSEFSPGECSEDFLYFF